MYHNSACCLMNKILFPVLHTFLSCPTLLSRAGSDNTALGQSALCQNISIFWPFLYSSLGTCCGLLSAGTVTFPSALPIPVLSHPLLLSKSESLAMHLGASTATSLRGRLSLWDTIPCAHKGWIVPLTLWAWAPTMKCIYAFVGKHSLFSPSFP